MNTITEQEIMKGITEAYKQAGHNAYFGNGFRAGIEFALKQEPDVKDCGDQIHEMRVEFNNDKFCPICGKKLQPTVNT